MSPIVPKISTDIYRQLGLDVDFDLICASNTATSDRGELELPLDWESHQEWGILKANCLLGEAQPIFTKLELNITTSN